MDGTYKQSKGISPLVASVLLIAVTMTIAGVLAYWSSSFVKTSLPDINQTESECLYADFSIYSCTYYNNTQIVTLSLENLKSIELKDLKLFFIYSNSTVSVETPLNNTLPGGALRSFQLTGVTESFSKILIKTHCPDKSKEKACILA